MRSWIAEKTLSTEQGIDLDAYNSASTAAAVVDVASAMGYESFNLYGASYGTLLALTVMRDFPANITQRDSRRSSPSPSESLPHTLCRPARPRLTSFFRHCEADWDCSQRYPNLEETFWKAVDRYTDEPFILEYYDRYADDYFEEEFDGDFVVRRMVISPEERTLDSVHPVPDQRDRRGKQGCGGCLGASRLQRDR